MYHYPLLFHAVLLVVCNVGNGTGMGTVQVRTSMGDLFRWSMGPAGFGFCIREFIRIWKRMESLLVGRLGVVMLVGMLVGTTEKCSECWLDLAEGLGTVIG